MELGPGGRGGVFQDAPIYLLIPRGPRSAGPRAPGTFICWPPGVLGIRVPGPHVNGYIC
jgi:hypothetical protein